MREPDPVPLPAAPRRWLIPLLVFVAIAAIGIGLSHFTPVGAYLNTDTMREVAEALGWRGPLLLFAIALIAPLLFLPRWPIAMVCGMLYGVIGGALLANCCGACGAWVQFQVAVRTLSPVADQYSGNPWMVRLAQHRERAFLIVFLLRAFPFTSSVATNLLAGTLKVGTRTFLSASFLGMFPSSLMYAACGKLIKQPSPRFYVLAVAIVILFTIGAWIAQRRLARWLQQSPNSPSPNS